MLESQSSGRLCRSTPVGSVPPSGRTAHVLVAASQFTNATDLNNMALNIRGTYHPDGDTTITVQNASLQPSAAGLLLTISGTLFNDVQWPLPNVDATFDYTTLLHLHPSTNIGNPSEVMTVSADQGDLHLHGNGWTDDAEIWWNGNVEPQFRSNVALQATQAVNNAVAAKPQTQWFRSLGYTVSVRSLSTSASGLTVWPSLCKVD
jgi:hypothetical protein